MGERMDGGGIEEGRKQERQKQVKKGIDKERQEGKKRRGTGKKKVKELMKEKNERRKETNEGQRREGGADT